MARPRPGALTAAGVLCIIYGSLGLLCGILNIANVAFIGALGNAGPMDIVNVMRREMPGYFAVNWINGLVQFLDAIALLMAGCFLFGRQRWARTMALVFVLESMIRYGGYASYRLFVEAPAMLRNPNLFFPGWNNLGGEERQVTTVTVYVMIIGMLVIFLAYQFVALLLLTRPSVNRAFADTDRDDERHDFDDRFADGPERRRPPDDDYDEDWEPRRPADDQKDEWRYK